MSRFRYPALSTRDYLIYRIWSIWALLSLGLILLHMILTKELAYTDPKVISMSFSSRFLIAIVYILFILRGIALFAILSYFRKKHYPIFGREGMRYGPSYRVCYPLMTKKKFRLNETQKDKAIYRRNILMVGVVILSGMVCLLSLALTVSIRNCLLPDGTVQVYNGFNQVSEEISVDKAESLCLDTEYISHHRGSGTWSIYATVEADGNSYEFKLNFFEPDGNLIEKLQKMEMIKSCYAGKVRIQGQERLEDVTDDYHMTEDEKMLLYRLFDIPVP